MKFSRGSTVIYNGSSAQLLARLAYYNLQIDNPAGVDLPGFAPLASVRKPGDKSVATIYYPTVEGALTLTNGDLRTGASQIVLGPSATLIETAPFTVLGKLSTSRQCMSATINTFGGMGIEIALNSGDPHVSVARITGRAAVDTNKTFIKRRFDLSGGGSGLDAAIKFYYAVEDLDGINESNLRLYESTDGGAGWRGRACTLNAAEHSIAIAGVKTLTSWSAGQPSGIPTLSGIFPSLVEIGSTLNLTITGSNLFAGTTSISLGAGIIVNSVAVRSPKQIIANISVGNDAVTGARDIVVINAPPGGGTTSRIGGLNVQNPVPSLSGISPAQAARGDALIVTLTGSNLIQGVTTFGFGDGIVVNSVSVVNSTQASVSITVGTGAVLGSRNFSVTNPAPGGGSATLSNVFTVGNPVPTLSAVSPSAGKRGQTVNLTLTGAGFISGVTTAGFGGNIVVNSLVVKSAAQMTANISIDVNAVPGARGISATNPSPGGGTATLAAVLTVENPVPGLTSLSPVSGNRGTSVNVALTGANFIAGLSQVSFGPDIQVNAVTVSSPSQVTAGITIAPGASTGARDVLVSHAAPGGGTVTMSGGFSVTNPVPTVSSVTPVSAGRGGVLNVKISGAQFISGVTSLSFGPDISVSNLVVKSSTELQASISISSLPAVGARAVTISNAGPGGGTANLPNAFIVSSSPANEIQSDPGALPKEYVLQEAYPNPFNPSTRISYSLPEDSRIWLEVHNMLGNVVAELAVGDRPKGSYELQWHADNLPSGVYLVRMHAESLESSKRFIASRKVVLVK